MHDIRTVKPGDILRRTNRPEHRVYQPGDLVVLKRHKYDGVWAAYHLRTAQDDDVYPTSEFWEKVDA